MNTPAVRQHSLAMESWIFAGRLFVQWRRYPMVVLQSLLFPTLLLVTYSLLVGKSMVHLTGNSGLDLLIPVCAIAGAMSGSVSAGMAMAYDRENGLLTRLWVMPVHRASPLAGALLAEAMRTLVGSVLLVVTGYLLGFRYRGNVLELAGYLLVPSVVVVVFTMVVISLALRDDGPTILAWVGTGSMGLAFAALMPVAKLPAILRPPAEYQPVALTVRVMHGLSSGAGGYWLTLVLAAVWICVLAVVFGRLAVINYRQAAETGRIGK